MTAAGYFFYVGHAQGPRSGVSLTGKEAVKAKPPPTITDSHNHEIIHPRAKTGTPEPSKASASFIDWAVTSLEHDFAGTIALKSSQVKLMQLRLFLAEKYPGNWKELFETIIKTAFPDYAEEIFEVLARMDRYNTWLEERKADLPESGSQGIYDALWAKRKELFGDDAQDIWAEETRTEVITLVLDAMREDYDTGIDEKIALFTQVVNDAYHGETDFMGGDRVYYLTRAFLRMDSVQENLHEMNEPERKEALRTVRKNMGFSDEAIEKMELLDAEKEERWQTGYRYMEERARILASFKGEGMQQKIAVLQNTCFGKNAKTIRAEEASGFFRFDRPRVYGCN